MDANGVMTVDDVKVDLFERDGFGSYKFVRVAGEYRFISVGSYHRSCLDFHETAETAAFLEICERDGKRFGRPFGYSMTLTKGWDAVDVTRLPEELEFELDWNMG